MRIRILLLALIVHQSWTHPSYSYGSTAEAEPEPDTPQQNDNPERDGESSKRIIGSSVVTSVSVILNGNEPEYTDAVGMKVPKPQVPHLQVASPINLLNPDRYEFYTFDDNGDLVKRLMTMQEIQSIVANGDGEGPTIIHSAPIDDRDPEKNVQDIVKSVQSVLNREVESNKNSSDIQPILDTPDVSSSWSMILPAIFGNTGGDIFPQNKPQQVVMTPDSDVFEATTKATNKRKPSGKPKPQKKKNANRRKTTTKRVSTTTPIPEQETDVTEVIESTTRKVFINNQEETSEPQHGEHFSKRPPGVHGRPAPIQAGTKRPAVNKLKNKTKRPATTTPEPATEPITTTPEPTTTTTTTTELPTTTAAVPVETPAEETIVKEKPPQKKRKKPTRKPSSTPAPFIEVSTERHIGHYHKRKQTTPRPYNHHKHRPTVAQESQVVSNQAPVNHKNKITPTTSPTTTTTTPVPTTTTTSTTTTPAPTTTTTTTTTPAPTTTTTTTTTPAPTTTTTTPAPTTTTTTTTPAPTTTTTTTTPAPTTTTTTTTTPAPTTTTTTTTTPAPTTTTTTTTPAPTTTTTPAPTTTTTTTTPAPTTTTTTTTPAPTTTTTTTTPFTFATYSPTPPTSTTQTFATYRPTPPTTTSSYYHSTTTKKPFYAPGLIHHHLPHGEYGHSTLDFAPSLKLENIPMPGKLSEKQEDINTKLSFDQILQSLKEETATEDEMQASGSEEVQMPVRLPSNAYPTAAENIEEFNETPSPIRDLPMTIASTSFQAYDELDEQTSRPITQGKPLDSYESLESLGNNDSKKDEDEDEEEGPLVIITSRPQHHISNKPLVQFATKSPVEVTTSYYEPETTTISTNDEEEDTTTAPEVASIREEESAHVVKFEPLYAEAPEPVVTTFATTTAEPPATTISDEFAYSEEDEATLPPTTMAPMESIMQKIDAIISMSLKANGTLEMNNGHIRQSVPHISTMTMKDFKTQAATVASILEDNNTSQSSETTVMNSSETKDEIEFLLSDVINQMTQSQQPTIATTTMPNIVAPKPQPTSNQDETAHRLSNFAQINPALHISAAGLTTPLRQPTVDESIKTEASVPQSDVGQPQDLQDEAATTVSPEVENESNYVLISQGNDDYPLSLENTVRPLEDETNAPSDDTSSASSPAEEVNAPSEEEVTTPQSVELTTQKVYQTTQRGYVSSEEESSSEENVEQTTTTAGKIDSSISDDSTEEDGSEQMIVVTSPPDVAEEEKSTEIPGETAVVFSDSDMEESYEGPEFTTIIPALQTGSHLLEGEDPYVKLGEIGAKPTIQSLAQMIYGHTEDQTVSNESAKVEEKSEEAEKGKIDENPSIQESDILPKIEDIDSVEPTEGLQLKDELTVDITTESVVKLLDESSTPVSVESTEIPQMIQIVQPSKKPMMNMAQMALEQALMYATKVPLDFEDDISTTIEPIEEEATTPEPEVAQKLDTTQSPPVTAQKTTPTQAPSSTTPTKKIPNTLKPVSYFNKQSSLIIPDQKFNNFQVAQQRPVVRPASLSNLKMPQSAATRSPVKLDPSPAGSLGLEASTTGLDDDLQQFAQLCNELAFTYWRSITSEKISSARSLVISPFALTSMLSMVFLGARGSTSGEMNEVLKLDDMVTFNPHLVFKNITDSVEKATDSEIASSAFVREAFSDRVNGKILQFFKEKTQQFYSGHVEEVNFHVVNDIIRRRTNLLVKRHTMGKVLEYLRTNSVWVSGPLATISANLFQTDCSRASINDRDGEMFFQVHPSIRQRRLVPIPAVLYRSGFTAGYEPNLDATVVAFGRVFDTVSTVYVMPGQQGPFAPADSLDILERNLIETAFTKHAWKDILTSLMERPGLEVQLPRFSHRSFVNASMGLQKMGLKGLFKSELADLRGLTGLAAKDIYLSDMIQINTFSTCAEEKIGEHHHVEMYPAPPIRKRNKDVRESEDPENDSSESVIDFGSIVQETSMARAFYDDLLDPKFLELPLPLRPRQARIPDAPRLRFDRPFLYFVRHNPTGMILFMGRFNPRLLP